MNHLNKKKKVTLPLLARDAFSLGIYEAAVKAEVGALDEQGFARRLWEKDVSLWKADQDDAKGIKNALGWLDVAKRMEREADELMSYAKALAEEFTSVVLLGMGGSSLAPLVLSEIFGVVKGYPALKVLDSTCPEALSAVESSIDVKKTLFIVSSKSGSTIEPLSFFKYFYAKLVRINPGNAGKNFIAITDPSSVLEGYASKYGFRRLFTNPADIGGRFSALSFFGLVPAALAGIDIKKIIHNALIMEEASRHAASASESPGLRLGVALGVLYKHGRDKITFLSPKGLESFGLWTEQLLAESTGKNGVGLVPISNEPLGAIRSYGSDRVFVYIGPAKAPDIIEKRLTALATAGHPVIRLFLACPHALGAEFLRWEVATAVAGSIMGINPFNQPDVELSKKHTLDRLLGTGSGKKGAVTVPKGWLCVNGRAGQALFGVAVVKPLKQAGAVNKLRDAMKCFLGLAGNDSYVALLAYANSFDRRLEKKLRTLQKLIRDLTGLAVQFGWGPRYLHSTGQLHKGGAPNAVFIILTHDNAACIGIPESTFGFSELFASQALGDMDALDSKGRKVVLLRAKGPRYAEYDGVISMLTQAMVKRHAGGKK
ncbi:glucose-6-phosphate isomerase [bacterium]|nr:MAG: glucose-6-phosphate isomerase [bacterium]